MMPLEEAQFQELLRLIFRKAGLDCSQYKVTYLKRRLSVRMRATQKSNYREYQQLLEQQPEEYDHLLDRLTINVSEFFRDPEVYDQIKRRVLPGWRLQPGLRVWSAGCANGQEPYSLAILLSEALPEGSDWQILATDVDPTVVERARAGIYGNESLNTVPVLLRKRYFDPVAGGKWAVKTTLKRRVQFKIHDLTGELPRHQFDMIVCRNVLIYFVSGLQERLFKQFNQLLRPQGYLVLGKTETLLGEMRARYTIIDIRERIYQKKEPAGREQDAA